jgi:hypothetical protein
LGEAWAVKLRYTLHAAAELDQIPSVIDERFSSPPSLIRLAERIFFDTLSSIE